MCFTSAHMHVCVCIPLNTMSCPGSHILLDLALCSGSDQDISVRSSHQLPRTDMQHSVTQDQSQSTWPHICLTLCLHFSQGKLGMLWQSCLQPDPCSVQGSWDSHTQLWDRVPGVALNHLPPS